MRAAPLKIAYIALRFVALLCVLIAIGGAFAGARFAGSFVLAAFCVIGLGAFLNVYVGLAEKRVYLGNRELTRHAQPALFNLWFFVSAFGALVLALALVFILVARFQ